MSTGVVKNWIPAKGFGFIKPDDGGKDLFMHVTVLKQIGLEDIGQGTRLSFEVDPNPIDRMTGKPIGKGPRVVSVSLTD